MNMKKLISRLVLPLVFTLTIGLPVWGSYVVPDGSISAAKLAASAVTTAKINDGAVTAAKKAALGQQLSSSCGTFTTASASYVDVTNLSVTLTTTGRPVRIEMISDGSGTAAALNINKLTGSSNSSGDIQFLRDATEVGSYTAGIIVSSATRNNYIPMGTYDVVAAGTYVYKVRVRMTGGDAFNVNNFKLIAFEM